jgi:predicted DNA-binding transcriptional regulator AlpA
MNSSRSDHEFQPTPGVASPGVSPDIGLSEVAQILKVSKSGAIKYAARPDFPQPRQLARGRVWDSDEVLAWAKATLPLRQGRPPKPRD